MSLLKFLRIFALFLVLVVVAGVNYQNAVETTDWDSPLRVAVYPVNADGSPDTARFIEGLTAGHYEDVEVFFTREGRRYDVGLERPVDLWLGELVAAVPPPPPADRGPLRVAAWSLRLRLWTWWTLRDQPGPPPQVRVFALFHDPETSRSVPDSLGLRKGLIGVAHGFAAPRLAGTNALVLAHELLHTLGATDKYDPATSRPLWPEGYAEPDAEPLHPQRRAEIMAGRLPVSENEAVLPAGLAVTTVGPATAREIGWAR
ncbi:MAG: hypothetical protein P8080_03635 [Gammaproteobacteria bacterium]